MAGLTRAWVLALAAIPVVLLGQSAPAARKPNHHHVTRARARDDDRPAPAAKGKARAKAAPKPKTVPKAAPRAVPKDVPKPAPKAGPRPHAAPGGPPAPRPRTVPTVPVPAQAAPARALPTVDAPRTVPAHAPRTMPVPVQAVPARAPRTVDAPRTVPAPAPRTMPVPVPLPASPAPAHQPVPADPIETEAVEAPVVPIPAAAPPAVPPSAVRPEAPAVPAAGPAPSGAAPVEVKVQVPGGAAVPVRLVFRQGVQVAAAGLPRAFLAREGDLGAWVPFTDLSGEGKRWALQGLFPRDTWDRERVMHRVRWPAVESVWLLASLFMGHGQHYDQLQAANPANPEKLRVGDVWLVPRALLSEELGGRTAPRIVRSQPEDSLDDEARVAAYRAMLAYEEDAQGKYAAYHLRKGEALYSSVVMRYTDQVDPGGVNALALVIARRSGIPDVRGIQPGQLVKIPLETLASPFQPEGTVALAEEREVRDEIRRTPRVSAGSRLQGIRIVLDPGHGGVDKGAMANGIWESDFVYDITMRVRRLLEEDTDALVSCTVRYPDVGFKCRERIRTPSNAAEVLTRPPFSNDGDSPTAVSVHLRWVLANSLFAGVGRAGDPRGTLFISFHADSLHPSARGTMVYVPGAVGVPAAFTLPASRAVAVQELGSGARVSFSPRERLQGEARSRLFAETLLNALQDEGVPTHENRPIRNVVLRGGKSYIPAVIRYNTAATKILVEVANLTNRDDASNLRDPAFRERYARAVVKGIQAYYRN